MAKDCLEFTCRNFEVFGKKGKCFFTFNSNSVGRCHKRMLLPLKEGVPKMGGVGKAPKSPKPRIKPPAQKRSR